MARRLDVFLIRPTKYDDDGYLLRHARGVLPSNTLACLNALTEDVARRGVLGAVALSVHLCDESVQAVPERRIASAARRRGGRVIVGLVGVQTSQFPRAVDLALRLRAGRVAVLIGGFHVSGTLATLGETSPDLQRLTEAGVTLVSGEVERIWDTILADAVANRLAARYDALPARPDLGDAPVPRLPAHVLRRFVHRHFATLDAGRGCPFSCSFCTIIAVQGRAMRVRDPRKIAAAIELAYRETGTYRYFFTDDNFARNPTWRALFEELIRLREERGLPLGFLMQVDLLAHRIPGFVALARRAGCFQVFLGMETINAQSLADGSKRQNDVTDYRALIDTWRAAGIVTHVGYIIGFPHDDPTSVRADLRVLCEEVQPAIASFFMLTPLPGSADHRRAMRAGTPMDDDLNHYDTFHAVVDHPRMSREAWAALYREAWQTFYSGAHMRRQLALVPPAERSMLMQMYLWYRAAADVEGFHPMMSGLVRLKPRRDRRPGSTIEGRLRHLRRRLPELWAMLGGYLRLVRELQHLWAELEHPGRAHGGVAARAQAWWAFLAATFGQRAPGDSDRQRRAPTDGYRRREPPTAPRTATSASPRTDAARQAYANPSPTRL